MNKETINIIKAMRRARREEEIALFGKPILYNNIIKSKKIYSRKKKHKNQKELNF